MNRKSNPWVALVALILMLVVCCSSCESPTDAAETDTAEGTPRFIIEEASVKRQNTTLFSRIAIITDTETGVQYIVFKGSDCTGMTKLEPAPEKEAN